MYLGVEPLLPTVPQTPNKAALVVVSLTWRRGLRSEFLWSGGEAGPCLLWERLLDLTHHNGVSWTEVFAWTHTGTADPARSALRLFQRGWAKENLAYDWLAAPKRLSQLGVQSAFSVTAAGIVSKQQIEWLFLTAARSRAMTARHAAMVTRAKRPTAGNTRNIGPYPFDAWSSNRKAAEPRDIRDAIIPPPVPADRVMPAEVFAFRRERKRRSETPDGDAK